MQCGWNSLTAFHPRPYSSIIPIIIKMCGKWLGEARASYSTTKGLARRRKVAVRIECHERGDGGLPTEARQPVGTTCERHEMKRSSVSEAEAA